MNLFSKIQNAGKQPATLTYELPQGLRIQIMRLWDKRFGISPQSLPFGGIIAEYFLNLRDTSKALDVVQVVFGAMEVMLHRINDSSGDAFYKSRYQSLEIIDELNSRFTENNVGYQYVQGRIQRIAQGPDPVPLKERLISGEPVLQT